MNTTTVSAATWLPPGYALIQGATFAGETFGTFGFKRTPITNGEWGGWVGRLGEDRFVLMRHDQKTGETRILKREKDIRAFWAEGVSPGQSVNWDAGEILVTGALVFFKLVENPSAAFDGKKRIFSGSEQPALVSFFEAMAWCLLNTRMSGGRLRYDLPTDAQYEYVASNDGKQEYGTSTGQLYGPEGQKLAYLDECRGGQGTTVSVSDPRNSCSPMGVQVTGNVRRWTRFNQKKTHRYGLRGGSWLHDPDDGRASCRSHFHVPEFRYFSAGFSPVAILRNSPRPVSIFRPGS